MGLIAAKDGWLQKNAGAVLGIHPCKVGQATRPAFVKIARLMRADAHRTMQELLAAMDAIEARADEVEFAIREAMADGQIDTAYVHRSDG